MPLWRFFDKVDGGDVRRSTARTPRPMVGDAEQHLVAVTARFDQDVLRLARGGFGARCFSAERCSAGPSTKRAARQCQSTSPFADEVMPSSVAHPAVEPQACHSGIAARLEKCRLRNSRLPCEVPRTRPSAPPDVVSRIVTAMDYDKSDIARLTMKPARLCRKHCGNAWIWFQRMWIEARSRLSLTSVAVPDVFHNRWRRILRPGSLRSIHRRRCWTRLAGN
ncbi:MAG: hypothetical protein QOJ86_52 [Bradyrhizobium sp.]|nr:hypothetical protein [Bradyrhizobium sp.]